MAGAKVPDLVLPSFDFLDGHPSDGSLIVGLPAAAGVERSAIQGYPVAVGRRDDGLEFSQIAVVCEDLLCHDILTGLPINCKI
jgi:hypothetical protein